MLFSGYKFTEYKYVVRTGIPTNLKFKLNGFVHEIPIIIFFPHCVNRSGTLRWGSWYRVLWSSCYCFIIDRSKFHIRYLRLAIMTEVFLDFSQPLEAISRHIHTVAGEPEWSSSLTSKPAVNINLFEQVSPTSLHQHSAKKKLSVLMSSVSFLIFLS
jgi:hypothetical protein